MSSTERNKNEALTRKVEEERMQTELLGMDMYDHGMTFDQMKSILYAINESKTMAISNDSSSSRNTRSASPENSASGSKTILPREPPAQRIQERPKPSFSYKEPQSRSQARSNSTDIFDGSKLQCRSRARSNSSDIFDGVEPKEESVSEAAEQVPTVPDSVEEAVQNNGKTYPSRKRNKEPTEKPQNRELQDSCIIDPIFVIDNDNAKPLQRLKRRFRPDPGPWGICKDPSSMKRPQETLEKMSEYLSELSTKLFQVQRAKSIPKEFEWGSPIKVGVDGHDSEKSQYLEVEQQRVEEKSTSGEVKDVANSEEPRERASKRKAITLISNISEDSDEDDVELVSNATKRVKSAKPGTARKQTSKFVENTESEVANSNCSEKAESEEGSSSRESKQSQENDESMQYPRRIVPPSRGKRRLGPRCWKEKSSKRTRSDETKSSSAPISEKQITIELEQSDDELTIEEDVNSVSENVDVKPLPVKKISQKLLSASAHLKIGRETEKKKEKIDLEKMKKDKEEEERKRFKKEQIHRIILMNEQKKREEKKSIEAEKEKQGRWNEYLRSRERAKKAEIKMLGKESNDILINMETVDADEEVLESSQGNSNNSQEFGVCPICNKQFRMNKLEDHASQCYQYEDRHEEKRRTRNSSTEYENSFTPAVSKKSEKLVCQICEKFKTRDAIIYEEHVHRCIRLREDSKSSTSNSMSAEVPINVPVSPPKCYQPLSHQPVADGSLAPAFSLKKGSTYNSGAKRRKH